MGKGEAPLAEGRNTNRWRKRTDFGEEGMVFFPGKYLRRLKKGAGRI